MEDKAIITFPITDYNKLKIQMLNWADQFNIFCLLENHRYNFFTAAFEYLLAVGSKKNIEVQANDNAFEKLKRFSNNKSWLFGHLNYDVKNEIEELKSAHENKIGFSDLHFFEPEILISLSSDSVTITASNPQDIFIQIQSQSINIGPPLSVPQIKSKIPKQKYIDSISKLKDHIQYGDCYEINFCQEFFIENFDIDPIWLYQQLSIVSPNPFSTLYKIDDKYCIGASPERYLQKKGNKLLSQPIKGTSRRDLNDEVIDNANKQYLKESIKERSENIIVVDLVRNDLSKICLPGTVKVDELCEVYSFPQVHQMISSISGIVNNDTNWVDIIKATFPMGSMTGAPKKKVMELIEKYECSKRGLFSGAIGYVTPKGDFDFNVVIRSTFYNKSNNYLSYFVGSGITHHSDPEKEYEECLLKMIAFTNILQNRSINL